MTIAYARHAKAAMAAALVLVIAGLIYWQSDSLLMAALAWRFQPRVDFAAAAPAATASARRAQDAMFLAHLAKIDASFTPAARARFETARAALVTQSGGMTDVQFLLGTMRAVAVADNGHTGVRFASWTGLVDQARVRLAWFQDGLYVVRARGEGLPALGARVDAIDGATPQQLADLLAPYFGGTALHRRHDMVPLMVSPAALHALRPDWPPSVLRLSVVTAEGARQVEMGSEPADGRWDLADRLMAPERLPTEADGWHTVLDASRAPLSLQHPDDSVFAAALPPDGIYIGLRSISGDAKGGFADQANAVLAHAPAAGWRRAIVDLRGNGGGDFTQSAAFARALPRHLAAGGRLVVLIDGETFSAAIVTAGWLTRYGPPGTLLLGTGPGDRARFWSERGAPLVLPNSRIAINYATAMHDLENGCTDLRWCFWIDPLFGVRAGKLTPDRVIPWRFADYAAGRDTALAAALQ